MAFKMKGWSPFTQKETTIKENKQDNDDGSDDQSKEAAIKRGDACAKCGILKGDHSSVTTHAFTTSASDPDWEGGDAFDVKPIDPDAPGTKGKPVYEPPVKRSDLDDKGKKIYDSHRKPK